MKILYIKHSFSTFIMFIYLTPNLLYLHPGHMSHINGMTNLVNMKSRLDFVNFEAT